MERNEKIATGVGFFLVAIIVIIYLTTKRKTPPPAIVPPPVDPITACRAKLNLYETDGKEYICPPQYSFADQNPNKYNSIMWGGIPKDLPVCWMTDGNKSDCGWGSNTCDPSTYTTPNGKTIVVDIAQPYINDPNFNKPGYVTPYKYNDLNNTLYRMGGVPYTDDYCIIKA